MRRCHYLHSPDKDITGRVSLHTDLSHSLQYIFIALTPLGSSDQILFQWRGECVGDPTLARDSQMKVRKHAFVAGSTSLAKRETRLILRVNHCNQNSL